MTDYQRKFQKEWRKKHPHYSRDYMRIKRGGLKGYENTGLRGTVKILGVRVRVGYEHLTSVCDE